MESIKDIVAEMRNLATIRDWHNHANQSNRERVLDFADRIEQAVTNCNQFKVREALEKIDRVVWDKHRHTKEEVEAHRLATEALTVPPRNCDIMSLETARKVWFAKEIIPRLNGDLPLGKEVPFVEWFVSQQAKGEAQ